MKTGDKVTTNHGKAIVIGFERFDKDGMTAPMADTFNGSERILCKLEPDSTWPFEGVYALYLHEYEKLN